MTFVEMKRSISDRAHEQRLIGLGHGLKCPGSRASKAPTMPETSNEKDSLQ